MRLSAPRLLIVIAVLIVVLIELRTVLAFFDVEVSFGTTLVVGAVVIGLVVLWGLGVGSSGDGSAE